MNNELKVFENPEFGTVRTTTGESGKVLFCGTDIAKALGITCEELAYGTKEMNEKENDYERNNCAYARGT